MDRNHSFFRRTKKNDAANGASFQERLAQARAYARALRQWLFIHGRRLTHSVNEMLSEYRAAGPVSFLAVSAALGLALTITTLYSSSYVLTVDGEQIGIVSDQSVVEDAIAQVERQGSRMLGYDYQVDDRMDEQFALTLKSDLSSQQDIENYFYHQLDAVSAELRKYQVVVDGIPAGAVEDKNELDQLLRDYKKQYSNKDTVSEEFVEQVRIENVYTDENLKTIDELRQSLLSNKSGSTTYTVKGGDTFNGIAYANDMSVSDLKALNPNVNINRLMIGDVLTVKKLIPLLSVATVDDVTYTEPIPCPVETVDDPNLYKGSSKIVTNGVPGETQIHAKISYLNGHETEREILSQETLREPTKTVKAVGTKEKPKTASTGTFSWPIHGRINSYFGGRYIFGRYSYHSGLDIQASYGAPIKAADGGTVTFSGYKGSYGNLVIITHDNGIKTYYAHNSSLLVSVGQKVYKGQTIAKAGSTGRSTGTHCHFEVRVNGTAVNPLSYLN